MMPKATPFSVIAGGLRGYGEGKRWREELEEKKRQRDLEEKLAHLQLELRQMQIQKPTVTSQGIMEWQPERWERSGDLGAEQTQIPAGWGWQPFEKEQPQGLTPRQKAELDWEFDKKKYDYQLANPKPTAKTKDPFITAYQTAIKTLNSINTRIGSYGPDEEIPPTLISAREYWQEIIGQGAKRYSEITGLPQPAVVGQSPGEEFGGGPKGTAQYTPIGEKMEPGKFYPHVHTWARDVLPALQAKNVTPEQIGRAYADWKKQGGR